MAKLFRHSICGHKNIYTDNNNNRELVIEYGEPDIGANNDTGILITVPGYGGDINSNVYRKMRKTLPDKYNMIVMQCDYFGNKYMHSDLPQELEKLLQCENLKQCQLVWKSKPEDMGESVEEFNDMGIMQALDIVNATLEIITLYLRNGYEINLNKIVLLGHSHGGYISHLANIICPGLFSFIIENSIIIV